MSTKYAPPPCFWVPSVSHSNYADELPNNDNYYFAQMLDEIYPKELQLNKANATDT